MTSSSMRRLLGAAALAMTASCNGGVLALGSDDPATDTWPPDEMRAATRPPPTTIAPCAGRSGAVVTMLADDAVEGDVGWPYDVRHLAVDDTHVYFVWLLSHDEELLLRAPTRGGAVEELARGRVTGLGAGPSAVFWARVQPSTSGSTFESWPTPRAVHLQGGTPGRIVPLGSGQALVGVEDPGAGSRAGGLFLFSSDAPSPLTRLEVSEGDFAFDGSRLFFLTEPHDGRLLARTLASATTTAVTDERLSAPLAVDDASVYGVGRTDEGFVLRAFPKTGGGAPRDVHRTPSGFTSVLADADALYLAAPGPSSGKLPGTPPLVPSTVWRVARGGMPVRVHEDRNPVGALASNASAVYIASGSGLSCYRK